MAIVILSDDYRKEQEALLADPIVAAMAASLTAGELVELIHPDGTPTFEFMLAANAEYRSRGGKASWSMGGVGRALATLVQRR